MNLTTFESILIGLSCILIIVIVVQWLIWKYRRRPFTRERFAFIGLGLLVSMAIYIIPYILGSNIFFDLLNIISTKFFEYPIKVHTPDFSDKFMVATLYIFTGIIYLRVFNNWKWKKSLHQHELEKLNAHTGIIKEALACYGEPEKLQLYNPKNDTEISFNLAEPEVESIAWHNQVFELLSLTSSQYILSKEKDWFPKQHCYISAYGKENQPLAVFCSLNVPSEKKVTDFMDFSFKQFPSGTIQSEVKYIVAIKNTKSLKENKDFKNIEIEFLSEDVLLDELIDFSNYFRHLERQFEESEIINGYKHTLKDIYTQPECKVRNRELDSYLNIENTEQYILDWVNQTKDKKHLAILGEYGQGKSVLSQRISYLMVKNQELTGRIPIIIELRGRYPKQYPNSLALLSDWCSNFSIDPKALMKLHHAGRILLIFEGFDEMELIGDYEIRVDHFRKLWGFSIPNSKIIITGRPNFFLNDNELKTLLRTSSEYTNLTYCEEIYLKRFSKEQISYALRKAPHETKSDILSILNDQNEGNSFFDLMSRPSSLFLTSIVWKERNISKYKSKINSALVIEEFLKHSYSRQENKGGKTALSIPERAYFMMGIAIGMTLKNGYTNHINQLELEELIIKLYNDFPEEITSQNLSGDRYKKQVQKRFNNRYNRDTILLDIRSCGVLVRDLSTFDSFKFAHKSFLELLVSDYITNSLIIVDSKQSSLSRTMSNSIEKTLNFTNNQLLRTSDITRFIAEQSIRKLSFKENLSDKEKIRVVFKHLYPLKFLSMESIFRLIPYLGHNIKNGLIIMVFLIISSIQMASFLVDYSRDYLSNNNFSQELIFISTVIIYITLPLLTCKLYHKVFVKTELFQELFHSALFLNPKSIKQKIEEVLVTEANVVYDNANLLVLFLICKELDILGVLKNMMSKKLYMSLKIQESHINRFRYNINEKEFIKNK